MTLNPLASLESYPARALASEEMPLDFDSPMPSRCSEESEAKPRCMRMGRHQESTSMREHAG